jgi:hypothetical protein
VNYASLKNLIATDPELSGKSDSEISALLNARTETIRASAMLTKTTLYKILGFAAGLELIANFKGLAAVSDQSTALKFTEILDLINPRGDGIDVSLDETRGVIDSLVEGNILTAEQGNTIKAVGEQTITTASRLGWSGPITVGDVETAKAF